MFSTRWIKILRDIQATPVRIAIMLVMMAIGVFSFTLMLSTYTTLRPLQVFRKYKQVQRLMQIYIFRMARYTRLKYL